MNVQYTREDGGQKKDGTMRRVLVAFDVNTTVNGVIDDNNRFVR